MVAVFMKVERVIHIEVPGLGAQIKDARLKDSRPVSQLAKAAGMTRANWHRIENEEYLVLPEKTLKKIEAVLEVDFGVNFQPDNE